jgi:hypothetical protein
MFTPATKAQARLRLGLIGVAGAGKTYTALRIAKGLGGRIALIDSENGSASKYAGNPVAFEQCTLKNDFAPKRYIEAIRAAGQQGFDVLIIDSLTHAWAGIGGALEMVDKAQKRSGNGNSFTAWREVTPEHNQLIDAILQSPCHVIATIRAKTEYVLEEDARGKKVPKKIGLKPVQRDGMEYEFDVVADITSEHDLIVTKTRCEALDRAVMNCPGEEIATILKQWLTDGTPYVAPASELPPAPETLEPRVVLQRYEMLLVSLERCVDAEVLGDLRMSAQHLKPHLRRDDQIAVSKAIHAAMERVAQAEEDRREAERVEEEIAREKAMLAEAERKQAAHAQLRDEVDRDRANGAAVEAAQERAAGNA